MNNSPELVLGPTENPDTYPLANPVRGEIVWGAPVKWSDFIMRWRETDELKVVDRFKYLVAGGGRVGCRFCKQLRHRI